MFRWKQILAFAALPVLVAALALSWGVVEAQTSTPVQRILGVLTCLLPDEAGNTGSGPLRCITTAQVGHGSPLTAAGPVIDGKITAPTATTGLADDLALTYKTGETPLWQNRQLVGHTAIEDETIRDELIDTDATDAVDWLGAFGINAGTNITFRRSDPVGAVYIDAAAGSAGLNTAAVNALIMAGVFDWAETGNTDLIPAAKLPVASSTQSGILQMGDYDHLQSAVSSTTLHDTPMVANADIAGNDAILFDDASITTVGHSQLREITFDQLDMRWGGSTLSGRLKFVGSALPAVASYSAGDLALVPNYGLFQLVATSTSVNTVSLTGWTPVSITEAGQTVYGFNGSNGTRPTALPSWILSMTRDGNNRITVTATPGNLDQLRGVRINIGSSVWVLTYAGTVNSIETYISGTGRGAPWTTAAISTTNAHFSELGNPTTPLHTTTSSQWSLIQSFVPGHYPHFDDTGLTLGDDSSLLIRFQNRWIAGEIVGATQLANGDLSIDARVAEALPVELKILEGDYEAGGWSNSTTSLINFSATSYASWGAMPADLRSGFAATRQRDGPNQDNWYLYALIPVSEEPHLTARRVVGDDNRDTGEDVIQSLAYADPPWVGIGTATILAVQYNLYRIPMGAVGSESTGGFGGLIDDYHYRVQDDHPSRWDIEVPYGDITGAPTIPPNLYGARKIAGVSANSVCNVSEMTQSASAGLTINLPTWLNDETVSRYICFGVESSRSASWYNIESRYGGGNIFTQYIPQPSVTVGGVVYTIRRSSDPQLNLSGFSFVLE